MAVEGHAPTFGSKGARSLWLLGQGVCPNCEVELQDTECPVCGEEFPIVDGDRYE